MATCIHEDNFLGTYILLRQNVPCSRFAVLINTHLYTASFLKVLPSFSMFIGQNFFSSLKQSNVAATDRESAPSRLLKWYHAKTCIRVMKGIVHLKTDQEGPEWIQRCSFILSLTLALDGGGWSTPRPRPVWTL
jgi:hypothetical protein